MMKKRKEATISINNVKNLYLLFEKDRSWKFFVYKQSFLIKWL
jgi:hypothetical protein